MHITLEADYALRIVDTLARSTQRVGAKVISEKTGVTLRFSMKILRKLVARGIVRSYRGAGGGYEIARPLEEVTVYEVLEVIEGPLTLNRCLRKPQGCDRHPGKDCPYRKLFGRLSQQLKNELSAVAFSDIVGRDEPSRI